MQLAFAHEGYYVITSSWTASFKGDKLTICYLWGADSLSYFSGATSVRRAEFTMSRAQFVAECGMPSSRLIVFLEGDN